MATVPVEMGIAGAIDHAHAAFAELRFDRVAIECLAYHSAPAGRLIFLLSA